MWRRESQRLSSSTAKNGTTAKPALRRRIDRSMLREQLGLQEGDVHRLLAANPEVCLGTCGVGSDEMRMRVRYGRGGPDVFHSTKRTRVSRIFRRIAHQHPA